MGSGLDRGRLLPAIPLVDTFALGVTSSFSFLFLLDPTSRFCNFSVLSLFKVDVVAVVDDVAICPSSTRLMSLGEAGVLTPG